MKNYSSIIFVLIAGILIFSCSTTKHYKTNGENCSEDSVLIGSFYEFGVTDTLIVRLVDEKSGECIPQTLDTVDWERNISLLVERSSTLILKSQKETKTLAEHEQIVGVDLFHNLGDLDGDGRDEIGFMFQSEDYSGISRYHIYSLSSQSLSEWFSFPIFESWFEDGDNPTLIYLEGDSIYTKEYHPEYDVELDYYARSRVKPGK